MEGFKEDSEIDIDWFYKSIMEPYPSHIHVMPRTIFYEQGVTANCT